MPGTRVMFVAVAAFPAAVSPDDLPAPERAGLLAGCCGGLAVGHRGDPLRGGACACDRSPGPRSACRPRKRVSRPELNRWSRSLAQACVPWAARSEEHT